MRIISKEKKAIDKDIISFLSIVKEEIYENVSWNQENEESWDWDYIYKTALKNNLTGVIYPAVARRKESDAILPSLLERWQEEIKTNTFLESKKYYGIRKILIEAEREEIKLVFFKGCVLAHLYPQYLLRNTSDTDIFVYERDKERAVKLFQNLNYTINAQHSKEKVLVFINHELSHIVELHFCLWEDYEGRKMDTMAKMDLVREESLIELETCEMKVITLGYEEHLIYQMFHIIKHFITEAVGVRYLVDITLYINRYGEDINFAHFWDQMKLLGFTKFCYTFFELCIQYFDMKKDVIKEFTSMNGNKEMLLLDIINVGLLFENKTSSWQILGIMTPYLVGEETIPDSRIRRKLKVLFPSPKALPDRFAYAKRNWILIPVAWAHKMIDFIIRYKKYNKYYGDWYDANQKLKAADYRLNLVKNLELERR